MKQHERLPE